jgi:hypothetical protein
VAVSAFGSELVVDGTLVSHVRPVASLYGRGLVVQMHLVSGTPSNATIRDCVVSDAVEAGVYVNGSSLSMTGVIVDQVAQTSFDVNGVGLAVAQDAYFDLPGDAVVDGSVVRDTATAAIMAAGGTISIAHTLLDGVAKAAQNGGTYGDGVVAVHHHGAIPIVAAHDSRITGAERGGVAVLGGHAELSALQIECAAIDLPASSLYGVDPVVADLGGNVCGCAGETKTCKVIDSELAVPTPPEAF